MVALHYANHNADALIVEFVQNIEVGDDLHGLHPHKLPFDLVVLLTQIVGHVAEILEKCGFAQDFLVLLTWDLVDFIYEVEYLHRQADDVFAHNFEQPTDFKCRKFNHIDGIQLKIVVGIPLLSKVIFIGDMVILAKKL